jgi:hypothetical protein
VITDNLATLFDSKQPGVRFRQGTILTWNSQTGENTVDLAGGTLTNVPIINTGEAVALKAGHVVGLLGQGSTWFIIGRVTPPNDPNFAGASVAFGGTGVSTTNFSVTTTHAVKASTSITVPSWVDEAVVLCTANATLFNTTASGFLITAQPFIDGVGGGGCQFGLGPTADASQNRMNSGGMSAQRVLTPGATIALEVQAWTTSGTVPADINNQVNLDAIAIFRSIA